ncbi:MAG: helix-turn-helix domain-containing protein [Myxococcales bacterium]|nr:helix-turn-helix domain-containing protein [Myxococcales bacterium]
MTKSSNADPVLLNIAEAAVLLRVRPTALYRWIKAGAIPHLRLSKNKIRFEKNALLVWINSKSVQPALTERDPEGDE